MRVAGVSIKSGQVYVAVAEQANEPHLLSLPIQPPIRVLANDGLDQAHRLTDLADRLQQDFHTHNVERIGLVATRMHANWKYTSAYERVLAISAVMLAGVELDIPYEEIKTERIGKAVEHPAKDLEHISPTAFGWDSPPKYWTAGGAEAFGATVPLLAS
ncbi:hypothetical protein [Kribbella soli]|uniref:Uncharacterized protein n=1 Tax=Kribbella soli TaxID=1124743 RepID=A0A4R0HN98_9ACTN|nr:hypothetical protein [Kribbella soli]TCC12153.1 hypothetical protein E0H45_13290 [Kribbella soli]